MRGIILGKALGYHDKPFEGANLSLIPSNSPWSTVLLARSFQIPGLIDWDVGEEAQTAGQASIDPRHT